MVDNILKKSSQTKKIVKKKFISEEKIGLKKKC